jgi:hypothetical protein
MESQGSWFSHITAGSWPDWVAAVFTSLAFMVAAVSYARSVKVHRESQARLVYSKVTETEHHLPGTSFELLAHGARIGKTCPGMEIESPTAIGTKARGRAISPIMQVTAVIHNGSDELIGPTKLQIVNVGLKSVYDEFAHVLNAIEPKSEYIVNFMIHNPVHPSQPSLGSTLLFRDASGSWWRRHLAEPIEAVHNDPENAAPTPTERSIYAANAIALGGEPTPDPEVPWGARWHRFWRRRRGKSPTP